LQAKQLQKNNKYRYQGNSFRGIDKKNVRREGISMQEKSENIVYIVHKKLWFLFKLKYKKNVD
jgi:hypothetical protein